MFGFKYSIFIIRHFHFFPDIPDINSGDIIIDGSDGGNSAIIDANDAARSVTFSSLIVVLSLCLSISNFLQVVR